MGDHTINILIGGEAGQGLLTVGQILVKCITRSGYSVLVTQNSQSRIRGGHNTFTIHMGIQEVVAPRESVDILVALNAETAKIHKGEMSSQGCIIIDETWDIDSNLCLKVPFKKWDSDGLSNIFSLGIVSSLIGLDQSLVVQTMNEFFSSLDQLSAADGDG